MALSLWNINNRAYQNCMSDFMYNVAPFNSCRPTGMVGKTSVFSSARPAGDCLQQRPEPTVKNFSSLQVLLKRTKKRIKI
uniref:Uncharacterized protein n=1 Tax=Haemonchus contortus TaxID=6289 RepID=A0A7I4YRK9_HAECO